MKPLGGYRPINADDGPVRGLVMRVIGADMRAQAMWRNSASRGCAPLGVKCRDIVGMYETHTVECGADSIGNVGRGKMAVVLLDHSRVRVTELRCDDGQGNTFHH
jgi:hypothetical protein